VVSTKCIDPWVLESVVSTKCIDPWTLESVVSTKCIDPWGLKYQALLPVFSSICYIFGVTLFSLIITKLILECTKYI
jgi:hypothetical protein